MNVPKSTWPWRPGGVSKRTATSTGSRGRAVPTYSRTRPYPPAYPAARTSSNRRCADSRGNSRSRTSIIALYGSSLCFRLRRGAGLASPAVRSRSNCPVALQWWIVRRLIPKRLDSSAFDTPWSR